MTEVALAIEAAAARLQVSTRDITELINLDVLRLTADGRVTEQSIEIAEANRAEWGRKEWRGLALRGGGLVKE